MYKRQVYKGDEDAENVYNSLQRAERQRYIQRMQWREQHMANHKSGAANTPAPPAVMRNLTFIHVGKAGGSTIACSLRQARQYISEHCDNIDYDDLDDDNVDPTKEEYIPDSAISRSVNCYTHWRMHLKCMYLQGSDPFSEYNFSLGENYGNFGSRRILSSSGGGGTRGKATNEYTRFKVNAETAHSHHHHDDEDVNSKRGSKEVQPRKEEQTKKQAKKKPKLPLRQDYLMNVRSPLDRIASWFVYEHTENHESSTFQLSFGLCCFEFKNELLTYLLFPFFPPTVYPDKSYHCGQVVISACYKHFEHLTEVGLSFPRPSPSQPLRVGLNLTAEECSHWAWATVQGTMPADYHNAYNYDWYAQRLLNDPVNADAELFVLRVEHLEQDWRTVDKMLGGDGSFPSTMSSRQNSATIKELRVPNHNTTDIGLQNLCRAMCDEIQVYKKLLQRAINIEPEDYDASMEDLRRQCPEEVDPEPRVCTYD